MSFIGNLLWIVLGGFLACLGYLFWGLVLCLTIIGIPFGIQSIKLGIAVLAPFGKRVVEAQNANSSLRVVFNLIWLLCFGWQIALAHVASAFVCAITIIGLPFAVQHIKLIPLSLFPFGRDLV
jgi:uncharacterized membrane protein YccF (DUF307 family)